MGRAQMGTLVNQRLGSMANPLNLSATLKWHKAIYIYIYILMCICIMKAQRRETDLFWRLEMKLDICLANAPYIQNHL